MGQALSYERTVLHCIDNQDFRPLARVGGGGDGTECAVLHAFDGSSIRHFDRLLTWAGGWVIKAVRLENGKVRVYAYAAKDSRAPRTGHFVLVNKDILQPAEIFGQMLAALYRTMYKTKAKAKGALETHIRLISAAVAESDRSPEAHVKRHSAGVAREIIQNAAETHLNKLYPKRAHASQDASPRRPTPAAHKRSRSSEEEEPRPAKKVRYPEGDKEVRYLEGDRDLYDEALKLSYRSETASLALEKYIGCVKRREPIESARSLLQKAVEFGSSSSSSSCSSSSDDGDSDSGDEMAPAPPSATVSPAHADDPSSSMDVDSVSDSREDLSSSGEYSRELGPLPPPPPVVPLVYHAGDFLEAPASQPIAQLDAAPTLPVPQVPPPPSHPPVPAMDPTADEVRNDDPLVVIYDEESNLLVFK